MEKGKDVWIDGLMVVELWRELTTDGPEWTWHVRDIIDALVQRGQRDGDDIQTKDESFSLSATACDGTLPLRGSGCMALR